MVQGAQPTKTVRKRGTKEAPPAPEAQGEDDDDLVRLPPHWALHEVSMLCSAGGMQNSTVVGSQPV